MFKNINHLLKSIHGLSLTITSFTLPIIMLIIGLKGNTALAAEISIIHSLIFLIFFPLCGNARNYILNSNDKILKLGITNFRIILYIPLLIIAFIINEITLKIDIEKFSFFIVVGSFFWFFEIFVTHFEQKGKNIYCLSFLSIISVILISFFFQKITSYNDIIQNLIYLLVLYVPIKIFVFFSYEKNITFKKLKLIFVTKIYHQIGSSFIVGVTSFLIKILIVTIYQKEDAGNIFLGFTIGGAIVTFFSYGVGPTILKQLKNERLISSYILKIIMLLTCILLLIFSVNEYYDLIRINNLNFLFYYSLYFSLIGSIFMIFGQYYKLFITQNNTKFNIIKFELIIGFSSISFVLLSFVSQNEFLITLTYILSSIITYFLYNRVYQKLHK